MATSREEMHPWLFQVSSLLCARLSSFYFAVLLRYLKEIILILNESSIPTSWIIYILEIFKILNQSFYEIKRIFSLNLFNFDLNWGSRYEVIYSLLITLCDYIITILFFLNFSQIFNLLFDHGCLLVNNYKIN